MQLALKSSHTEYSQRLDFELVCTAKKERRGNEEPAQEQGNTKTSSKQVACSGQTPTCGFPAGGAKHPPAFVSWGKVAIEQ